MLTTRWYPFGEVRAEMNRLQDEMNRLFSRRGATPQPLARDVYPPLDLWVDENNVYVEAELPGLELDDLEITVCGDNQLNVKGERRPPEQENGTWHRQERGYGSFTRMLELPSDVDSENVSAEFKNGVLTIILPKREENKPRRIEVKVS